MYLTIKRSDFYRNEELIYQLLQSHQFDEIFVILIGSKMWKSICAWRNTQQKGPEDEVRRCLFLQSPL